MKKYIISRRKYLLGRNSVLSQGIAFYIVLAILLLPYYQHQINPDGISYISISQKYIHHDYHNAINGYWGPLLSWLLIPFLYIGLKPLLSVKLLSLTIGLFTVIQSYSLFRKLNIGRALRNVLLYLIAVIVIYFALSTISPDLLVVFLALTYLNTILDTSYINSKYAGVICGFFGSLLYLSKAYGLPFFAFHFLIFNLIFILRTKDKFDRIKISRNYITGMLIFTLISISWIFIISNKYGYLTIGTSGSFNHALVGPQSLGHPVHYMGLLAPSNNTAISIWEDISSLNVQDWSMFYSISSLKDQIFIIFKNIFYIAYLLETFSILSLVLLPAAIIYSLMKGRQIFYNNLFFLLVSLIVLFSGYTMFLISRRYIWLSNILIIIIGAKLLEYLFNRISLNRILKIITTGIFVASFLLLPVVKLYTNLNSENYIFDINTKISQFDINGRIASDKNWHDSLYLSFYNGWQYYGERGRLNSLELETEFKEKMIDYYLVWAPINNRTKFLQSYDEITNGKTDRIKIYKLK